MLNDVVQTYVIPIGLHVLLAVVAWIVGRWLARHSQGWLTKSLQKTALTESLIALTKVEDCAPLQTQLVERVKTEFDAAGIVIPYPQQNVHLYAHS